MDEYNSRISNVAVEILEVLGLPKSELELLVLLDDLPSRVPGIVTSGYTLNAHKPLEEAIEGYIVFQDATANEDELRKKLDEIGIPTNDLMRAFEKNAYQVDSKVITIKLYGCAPADYDPMCHKQHAGEEESEEVPF